MALLRTWRTATVALLLVVLAITATTTTAGATTPGHQQAHYCKRVDAYRLETCATALLPDSPLGRQLRWVLAQLAGEAATLTEAEVRAHVSAEFLTIVRPADEVVQTSARPSPSVAPSPSSASPTHSGPARRWPWSRARPASGARCRSGSPAVAGP
jgi:hypothetical protein